LSGKIPKEEFKRNLCFIGGGKDWRFEQIGNKVEHLCLCWPQAAWFCSEFLVILVAFFFHLRSVLLVTKYSITQEEPYIH
jgi:hypothetical protein